MKRIILLAAFLLAMLASQAQDTIRYPDPSLMYPSFSNSAQLLWPAQATMSNLQNCQF